MSAPFGIEVAPELFLTPAAVAQELGISTSGVYKLIKRRQLMAIRRPDERLLIPRPALEATRRRRAGEPPPPVKVTVDTRSRAELVEEFEREHGCDPSEWLQAWRRHEIEDTAENMRVMVHATGLEAWEDEA